MPVYLTRKKKSKTHHLWSPEKQDTACRMASTGGLRLDKYMLVPEILDGGAVCQICKGVREQEEYEARGCNV